MSDKLEFDLDVEIVAGKPEKLAPGIVRVVANNPSPFTFKGTASYLVGEEDLAVIDPGPPDDEHYAALEAAIGGRRVAAVIVTHTHRDHSPLAAKLAARFDAPTYGFGPHAAARELFLGEINPLDAATDTDFVPDVALADGNTFEHGEWSMTALHTPGHIANHICLAMEDGTVFSGDHVMAWSTSIVAPPDGRMSDYMASLDRMAERKGDRIYWPGHGGPVREPSRFVRFLSMHRHQRELSILRRLERGDRRIGDIVQAIYKGLDERLHGAAGLSVLAHLEDLVDQGKAKTDGAPGIDGDYEPV